MHLALHGGKRMWDHNSMYRPIKHIIKHEHKTIFVERRGVSLTTRYRGAVVGMSRHVYAAVKKVCLQYFFTKSGQRADLRMSIGSEFQTLGAATLNARLAVSVHVLGTNSCRASVDRSDCIVS